MIDSGAMPSNKKKASHSEQDYAVGDRVQVNLHTGRIVGYGESRHRAHRWQAVIGGFWEG
jgi:hypothetical protein